MATEVKSKPLPDRQDIDTAPFWVGTDKGELQVKSCDDCSRPHWPPRLGCPFCGSGNLRWKAVAPKGALFSWTVVHRSQTPGFDAAMPYAVVLVELNDAKGVRMVGNMVNGSLDRLKAGLPMTAVFTPSADGTVQLVNWQPSE